MIRTASRLAALAVALLIAVPAGAVKYQRNPWEFNDSVTVDGRRDTIQVLIQGHSTQTSPPLTVETSDGTDKFTVSNAGAVVAAGSVTAAGLVNSSTLANTGVITPTGGIAAAGGFSFSPRLCHTGAKPASASTDGTNLTVVVTELYVAEVFVPANATITGVSVFWGDATEGNAKVALYNSAGTRVALSASTDVSAYTADSYGSRIPFATPYAAVGPATYYVGVIADNTSNRINTHVLGDFGAGKVTGLVYATEAGYATITPPTTFTTGLGPIASLY